MLLHWQAQNIIEMTIIHRESQLNSNDKLKMARYRLSILCVCVCLMVLTLASGWAAVAVSLSWIISGPFCLLKQQASSVQGGVRSHTGSILKGSTSLLFFPNTHTETKPWPPTWATGTQWNENDLPFNPFVNESFICLRFWTCWSQFHICTIIWSTDGKIISQVQQRGGGRLML